jgi:membrane-associated phospholipid phosphatase
MTFLTDFADQAVMLPLVLAIAIALLVQGWRRGAAAWVAVVCATFGVTLALKVLFIPCSDAFDMPTLHTPSGHVAAATVVVGGLAALLLGRSLAILAALATAALIGATRLVLGEHTGLEVVVGAIVGLAGVAALIRLAGPRPATVDGRRVVLIAVLVAVVFHGLHMPAEAHIRGAAWRLAHFLRVCPTDQVRL